MGTTAWALCQRVPPDWRTTSSAGQGEQWQCDGAAQEAGDRDRRDQLGRLTQPASRALACDSEQYVQVQARVTGCQLVGWAGGTAAKRTRMRSEHSEHATASRPASSCASVTAYTPLHRHPYVYRSVT
jgi:hypothetical protein